MTVTTAPGCNDHVVVDDSRVDDLCSHRSSGDDRGRYAALDVCVGDDGEGVVHLLGWGHFDELSVAEARELARQLLEATAPLGVAR